MPDQPTRSGRHRAPAAPRPLPRPLLLALLRPTRAGLLKTTGVLVAAVGALSAWSGPMTAAPVFELADAPRPVAATTVWAPDTALTAPQTYGHIGFEATPRRGTVAAPAGAASADRTDTAASRGIRRTGLRPELGLTQHGLIVLNAIRDHFPQIHDYGGFRAGDMDHGTGNAVDTMVGSKAQGDAVAAYVMAQAAELNVKYVIWYQRIWYPSSGTWKLMSDRGSPTANHLDHVHVSVN
ncbi:hypothetical protein ACFUC1_14085 [Pedococcus sp. NPDC057267]|uniref:hypothetical protein n=1 Tax=Pedococcus sp. NPDC057267 TaxID=3346077 RepID=UPI00362E0A26